jgi:hypothetical protein
MVGMAETGNICSHMPATPNSTAISFVKKDLSHWDEEEAVGIFLNQLCHKTSADQL